MTRQPVVARGVQREPAPAAADLEHVVVGAELQLVADALQLRALRVCERRSGGSKTAQEYVIVSSSISSKSSLPRS